MLLANKRTQKTAKKTPTNLFLKLKSFLLKNIKAKNRFYLEWKMSHNVTTETKNLLF